MVPGPWGDFTWEIIQQANWYLVIGLFIRITPEDDKESLLQFHAAIPLISRKILLSSITRHFMHHQPITLQTIELIKLSARPTIHDTIHHRQAQLGGFKLFNWWGSETIYRVYRRIAEEIVQKVLCQCSRVSNWYTWENISVQPQQKNDYRGDYQPPIFITNKEQVEINIGTSYYHVIWIERVVTYNPIYEKIPHCWNQTFHQPLMRTHQLFHS